MFIDSHCHLDRIDLAPYQNDFARFVAATEAAQIERMLCIGIELESYPKMMELVNPYSSISLSVGVHPNVTDGREPSVDQLITLGSNKRVIAVGETGLDYFRSQGDLAWQVRRFVNHIEAAKVLNKPLIIHTREAGQDALKVLADHGANAVGGIIHCFTEDWDYAARALDLNFYISFSGIVTFKNAEAIKDVARRIPLDRLLIETDSPYLAPIPYRGKPNYPQYVRHVAEHIAELRGMAVAEVARVSSANFYRLFAQAEFGETNSGSLNCKQ